MAVSVRSIALCTFVAALLFFNAIAVRESGVEKSKQENSLRNSTVVDFSFRINLSCSSFWSSESIIYTIDNNSPAFSTLKWLDEGIEIKYENAVDDPEAVAAMVNIDKIMQVTIAYNHFGEGLTQRMPRCRHGYFHVVNNDYASWETYAISGSANPTLNSQGNRFLAPNNCFAKEITKRIVNPDDNEWKDWNWRWEGDLLLNGAYFTPSGRGAVASYARASSFAAKPPSSIATFTSEAGVLHCRKGVQC